MALIREYTSLVIRHPSLVTAENHVSACHACARGGVAMFSTIGVGIGIVIGIVLCFRVVKTILSTDDADDADERR